MVLFLWIVGVLAWLSSGFMLVIAFMNGTDLQLIASGIFGTMGAVCTGVASVLTRLDSRTEAPPQTA